MNYHRPHLSAQVVVVNIYVCVVVVGQGMSDVSARPGTVCASSDTYIHA